MKISDDVVRIYRTYPDREEFARHYWPSNLRFARSVWSLLKKAEQQEKTEEAHKEIYHAD